ncbi:Clp protease [Rhodococcus sp. D2-41]|uniref:Clp protease N-terminal domain-containing protein n=1 Tax=Speluncibacter jeojiensis TaxID=2710754 RepID=UPI002410AA9A|nr:Clp protease N-terminal domain-containing protein [Rhodococcus sp. D2-41]MDG3009246.1 Clp protease [Rhodococcus sp. D2-41]
MFERFTRSAREAVVRAKVEAEMADSAVIDSRHLVLGVLQAGDGPAVTVLCEAGFGAAELRRALREGDELGDADAEALRSIGIDLDAVRASLEQNFGEGALEGPEPEETAGIFGWRKPARGHTPFTRDAKKSIELALRQAVHRKDGEIRPEHLLLGVLTGGEPAAARMIESKIAVADLRTRLLEEMGRAA